MKYTKYILSVVIPFVIIWIMASFINMSFDPNNWGQAGRVVVCVFGGFLSISAFMYVKTFKDR